MEDDSSLQPSLDETLEEWKKLMGENEMKKVDMIEAIQPWMNHPRKSLYINWKNDSIESGRTMLHCAIHYERLDIAKTLIQNGANVNIANTNGDTALIGASEKGNVKTVEILLDRGANLNHKNNKEGGTALIYASYEGHTKIVAILLERGADFNLASKNGFTALIVASDEGHTTIVQLLLDKGADPEIANNDGDTALIFASRQGHNTIVELLLDHGADVNFAGEYRYTPLILASYYGHTRVVEILLNKGGDPNIDNIDGSTALINASRQGHNRIVELLLERGADVNFANKDGGTALFYASRQGHSYIVGLLLDNGALLNISNKGGDTALIVASRQGHAEIAALLLDRGANVNIVNSEGDTALSFAAIRGHADIVELLLKKGFDPTVCNSIGQTFLHQACLHNKIENAKHVLELGTDRDKIDDNGHTALFYAAERGFDDIVACLMRHGVDVDKTDEREVVTSESYGETCSSYSLKDGRTPLFIAAQNGHQNVVALLLQHGADPYLCNNKSQIPRDVSVVHRRIQQLLQIQDFFDHREQGNNYNTSYRTCGKNIWNFKKKKNPVAPLEDIIHDIVKYPHFARKFLELYLENREIVNWLDEDGRTVRQVACKECREVTLFLRRYNLHSKPIYESPTCKIHNALDYGAPEENLTHPRPVAMKFFAKEEHFENEMGARRKDDGAPRFSSKFVIPYLAVYRADQDKDYAEACRSWKTNGTETEEVLSDMCIVMEQGERNLLEAMNAENLSAKHKDLERRDLLQKLCKIFSYLHGMGYVHGDIKPHNVVRHMGPSTTWKAIDFDACTKIGDVVGLKVTTGSAPPEMLKILKSKESRKESRVVLRLSGGNLHKSDLVFAHPSFDVWSYGILMYQVVTGRSFFHCDLQGNLDNAGLQELANLTQASIHKKIGSVDDVNARVLLSKILRLDQNERPTMSEVGKDYYFHPSESPQGRKAEFFGKQVSSISVPQNDPAVKHDHKSEERKITVAEKDEGCNTNLEHIESFLSSKSEFSYFKLRDEDKDWSDKLLNSEVETFHFDELGEMGEKPKIIDGDTIYQDNFLRGVLSSKGPDFFMGFLVEYFELYKIMDDAHEVCQGIKANLVSDVKDLKGIFIKLFVRGKGLNDVVRGTLFCNSIDQFNYVGRHLKERYGHNVFIKTPKKEAGAWPIPKLLIYGNNRLRGRCLSVEIQFSTIYMHLATHSSNSHLVYEAIRESTGYLVNKDKDFHEFLQLLNQQYIDTEGFLKSQTTQEGRFEILVEKVDEKDSGQTHQQESDKQYTTTKATGFITSGRICCGDRMFRFLSPADRFQRFSESSFVVNKSLTLLSSHSFWSDEPYNLKCKVVEFVVSFKGRGLAIAGIGTAKCLHGNTESKGGGSRCSVHVGRSKFVVRRSGVEEVFREKKFPNQARAKIRLKMQEGLLSVSFVGSNKENTEDILEEAAQVDMPSDESYYLYMRSPPGVHHVKFHEVSIT